MYILFSSDALTAGKVTQIRFPSRKREGRGSNGGIDEDAWAEEFDHRVKKAIAEHDVESLSAPDRWGRSLLAEGHPTLEHYAPILYCLGSTDERDRVSYPYEGMEFGAISMRMALFEPVDT